MSTKGAVGPRTTKLLVLILVTSFLITAISLGSLVFSVLSEREAKRLQTEMKTVNVEVKKVNSERQLELRRELREIRKILEKIEEISMVRHGGDERLQREHPGGNVLETEDKQPKLFHHRLSHIIIDDDNDVEEDIIPERFPMEPRSLNDHVLYNEKYEEGPRTVHRGRIWGRCLICCRGQMFHNEKKHCKKCEATTRCFNGARSIPTANKTVTCSCEDFFKTRVGHFIGTKKVGRCRNQSKVPRGTNFAHLTETGDICSWRYASWMRSQARALYLLKSDGVVAVTQAGRYFIYSEVHVVIQHPLLTGTMAMMIRCGKDVRELAKCIHPRHHTHTTCSVGAVTDLEDGAEIFLAVYLPRDGSGTGAKGPPAYGTGAKWPPPYRIHTLRSAYFGIIKFK